MSLIEFRAYINQFSIFRDEILNGMSSIVLRLTYVKFDLNRSILLKMIHCLITSAREKENPTPSTNNSRCVCVCVRRSALIYIAINFFDRSTIVLKIILNDINVR